MQVKETSPRYNKKYYTYQDYLDLPEDGERYEVINGELVIVPAPDTSHQEVSGRIEFELRKFNEKTNMGKVFDAPIDVVLSEGNVHQPDILFITNENSQIIRDKNISGAPDLIIEILSPSTAYSLNELDEIDHARSICSNGVLEYWSDSEVP